MQCCRGCGRSFSANPCTSRVDLCCLFFFLSGWRCAYILSQKRALTLITLITFLILSRFQRENTDWPLDCTKALSKMFRKQLEQGTKPPHSSSQQHKYRLHSPESYYQRQNNSRPQQKQFRARGNRPYTPLSLSLWQRLQVLSKQQPNDHDDVITL